MKFPAATLQLLAIARLSVAFSPILPQRAVTPRPRTSIFSSQWEEDDEKIATENKPTSFTDAGEALRNEDDQKRMDGMGDYDSNPLYQASDIERVRAAIKDRTDSLGIEKSKVSAEAIKDAQQRAQNTMGDRENGQFLDLTQISATAPRGQDDGPAMFYEPEDEMTEDEMKEADPDGQMSIKDQFMNEVTNATWPTPGAAFKEVFLLVGVVVFTALLIVNWDSLLRDVYTDFGFIPRPEDITNGSDNMVLPDGWTNNMSEEDFMKFQDEVASSVKNAPVTGGFSDL